MESKSRAWEGDSDTLLYQLEMYCKSFPEEQERCDELSRWLSKEKSPFSRHTLPVHITASGIVLLRDRVLLIYHPILGRWLQPGGHVEPGEVPLQAALREVEEETGMSCSPHPWHGTHPMPLDIDIHSIPANPRKGQIEHVHCDFRYLLELDCLVQQSECTHEWKFGGLGDDSDSTMDAVRRVFGKALKVTGLK